MPKFADIDMDLAQKLYRSGKSWDEIAETCGVSAETVRRRLDPVYAAKKREQREIFRAGRAPKLEAGDGRSGHRAGGDPVIAIIVPPDTRTRQQKFFGDPPKGRSAWDKRKAAANA